MLPHKTATAILHLLISTLVRHVEALSAQCKHANESLNGSQDIFATQAIIQLLLILLSNG